MYCRLYPTITGVHFVIFPFECQRSQFFRFQHSRARSMIEKWKFSSYDKSRPTPFRQRPNSLHARSHDVAEFFRRFYDGFVRHLFWTSLYWYAASFALKYIGNTTSHVHWLFKSPSSTLRAHAHETCFHWLFMYLYIETLHIVCCESEWKLVTAADLWWNGKFIDLSSFFKLSTLVPIHSSSLAWSHKPGEL